MRVQRDARFGLFVLIGGWPGSGKSTLARALAAELRLPLLAKDEIKETLADELGQPSTVAESQRLGRVAVLVMLRVAQQCPSAVMDSTWFAYTRPLVTKLPGRLVEIQCLVPRELARSRYYTRADVRHVGHFDRARSEDELWGNPPQPLGVGATIEVDTSGAVDLPLLATRVLHAANLSIVEIDPGSTVDTAP
ncbi:MAG: ATP-binding protein [Actinomycetota bacterium]|nr:ATP-binding protein [Actinomycetota bacterium]